jgi:hypothetical protein
LIKVNVPAEYFRLDGGRIAIESVRLVEPPEFVAVIV